MPDTIVKASDLLGDLAGLIRKSGMSQDDKNAVKSMQVFRPETGSGVHHVLQELGQQLRWGEQPGGGAVSRPRGGKHDS